MPGSLKCVWQVGERAAPSLMRLQNSPGCPVIEARRGKEKASPIDGIVAFLALLLRQKIEVELSAGTGIDDPGEVAGNIVGVAAVALGKGEGQF